MVKKTEVIAILVGLILMVGLVATAVSQSVTQNTTKTRWDKRNITASVPRTMTYQGILKDISGDPVTNDTLNITFRIFNSPSDIIELWSEEIEVITDDEGYFSAMLSDLNLSFDVDYYLELEVEGGSGPMTPRQKMNMAAYSAYADTCDFAKIGGGWVDDSTVVRLETETDSVGIGTATPATKLHVVGASIPPDPVVYIDQTGAGRGLYVNSHDGACGVVSHAGNHGLRVIDAGRDTNPFGDGVHVMHAWHNGIHVVAADSDGVHVAGAGGWAGYFNGTGYFRDNVGIGTTDPREKLEVAGNIRLLENDSTRSIYVEKSDGVDEPGRDLEIYAGEYSDDGGLETRFGGKLILHGGKGYGSHGGNVYIYGGGSDLTLSPIGDVILAHDSTSSGGNVGISVIEPSEKLDVDGTARLRGISYTESVLHNVVVDDNGVLWKESVRGDAPKGNVNKLAIDETEDHDKLTLHLLELVKTQQQQISALEKEIEVIKELIKQ